MAASGFTPISLYFSSTAAAVPLAANLVAGELSLNTNDGKLYYKNSSSVVTLLASTSGASGDVVGPASSTDNALARFDLATGKLIQNSVGILSDAGILTGLTGITSSGSITLSSLTSGRVPYATTAGLLTDSANLTFDGTNLTLLGGTANGVTYLNGSKVLTSGSALTFDGTTLGLPRIAQSGSGTYGSFNSTGAGNAFISYQYNGSTIGFIGQGSGILSGGSNTDFGIRAENNLVFGISFNEQMRLTSTGLGIGTSSPAAKFETFNSAVTAAFVANTPSTWRVAQIRNDQSATSGSASGIAFVGLTSTQPAGIVAINGNTTGGVVSLGFLTVSSNVTAEAMRIDSSGNVGIGTTSPSQKLTVQGSSGGAGILVTDGTNSTYLAAISSAGNFGAGSIAGQAYLRGTSGIGFSSDGGTSTAMTLNSSGNVGIGTSSPTAKLDVNGFINTLAGYTVGGLKIGGNLTIASQSTSLWIGDILNNYAAGVSFFASGSERMRIDSSGNIGLGVTPSAWSGYTALQIGTGFVAWSSGVANARMNANTYYNGGYKYVGTGTATMYEQDGYHAWYTAPSGTAGNAITFTQAMTLDSGNLLLGRTGQLNQERFGYTTTTDVGAISNRESSSSYFPWVFSSNGTTVGYIFSTSSATIYSTTSDYRLKTVIGAVSDSGSRIDALEPIEYTWNSNGQRTRGFLAHKFQEVYADSVTGTKDAIDADGKPMYQGMQAGTAEVIADLVAEIQSLRKRLTALELT